MHPIAPQTFELWIDWNNNGVWDGNGVDRFYSNVLYLPVTGLFSAKG